MRKLLLSACVAAVACWMNDARAMKGGYYEYERGNYKGETVATADFWAYGYEKNNATSQMHQSKKGIVLKQLNGLLYGVEYLNGYVGQETQMKSAALRGISIYLIIFIGKPSASSISRAQSLPWSAFP